MRKSLTFLVTLLLFLFAVDKLPQTITIPAPSSLTQFLTPPPPTPTLPPQFSIAKVTKVIDGDTFEIEGGKHVRYIGIDTPETKHPTKKVECFGKEASEKNRELVEGKQIIMEKDVSETDKYGRLLRYVYLFDPDTNMSHKGTFVNQWLVLEGYAHAVTFPPDVAMQELLQTAEEKARQEKKGLWKICTG